MATLDASPATEQHYSVQEIATLWNVSVETVRRLFRDEEPVLRIENPRASERAPRKSDGQPRDARTLVSIPHSTLERVHQQRSRGFLSEVKARRRKVDE